MGQDRSIDARELDRRQLYEKERWFAEKVRGMLEEHLEHRRKLRVYTPDQIRGKTWIWGIGPDLSRPCGGPIPYKRDEWIETVRAEPDGKIYLYWGSYDMTDLILDAHPRVYDNIRKKKGDNIEASVEALRKIAEDVQYRGNWKKYERRIPKVLELFRKCDNLSEEAGRRHNVRVEFWLNSRRCGIRAVVDTESMDEDEKLEAIMKAATALKDFNDRLYPET